MSTFTSKVLRFNSKRNKLYSSSLLNKSKPINTNKQSIKLPVKHNTNSKLVNILSLFSSKEVISEIPSKDGSVSSKWKPKTPRLSICKATDNKFNPKQQQQLPQSVKSLFKERIDLLSAFLRTTDYRTTIIIDNEGNNNLNLLPKKMISDTDLLFKVSKLSIDKSSKETTQATKMSNGFFTQQQRDEIDSIKPFDDNFHLIDNDETVSMTSFLSSEVNEMDKTVLQEDYLLEPIYTPRQLINKNKKDCLEPIT